MLERPECPACGQYSWLTLGEQVFLREALGRTAYTRLRARVLYELWAPEQGRFAVRYVLCDGCGFVAYLPRPSARDVDAKYRFVAEHETGGHGAKGSEPSRLDKRRSLEIHRALSSHLPEVGTLLDFGGGAGELAHHFRERGFECGVVDYTPHTVAGVQRLGSTLDDLDPGRRFDVVLSSHVFEHLADPLAVATRLGRLLTPRGVLFVEVPLETFGGPPKLEEPVTHINFFCPASLRLLLGRAGFDVLHCKAEACLFASGAYRLGVRATARLCAGAGKHELPGSAEARALLGVGWLRRIAGRTLTHRALLNELLP